MDSKNFKCAHCRKPFDLSPSQQGHFDRGNQTVFYCSKSCATTAHRGGWKGKRKVSPGSHIAVFGKEARKGQRRRIFLPPFNELPKDCPQVNRDPALSNQTKSIEELGDGFWRITTNSGAVILAQPK